MYSILRSFKTTNLKPYITIYKTYIRSIIEYNSTIWNPDLKSDIRKIESIQTKFTRKLCQKLNIKFNSYLHRLDILNLETLEKRRIKSDLILTYKFYNNLLDIEFKDFFQESVITNRYNLRRHNKYLDKPELCDTKARRNFFSNRIIKIWNKLPQDIILSKTLTIFKSKLNKIDLSKYTELVF